MAEIIHKRGCTTTVLITGASSGIGYELARLYLQQGATVFALARSANVLNSLVSEFPHNCIAVPVDLADENQCGGAGDIIRKHTDHLDLAILNAGTCEYVDAQKFAIEPFKAVMAVNWWGTIHSLEFCIPLLHQAKNNGKKGHLVIVGSMASVLPMPRSQAYGASKVALEYLVNSLRVDTPRDLLDFTLVRPGFVKTPLTDRNDFPMPWKIHVGDAAQRISKGISQRKFIIQFPLPLVFIMNLVACLPLRLQTWLLKKLA